MKKLSKFLLVTLVAFLLVGCGGGSTSTKDQEKVVTQFFDYIKKGEFDNANELGSNNYEDFFDGAMETFEDYLDEDTYGKSFVREAQSFIDSICENLIKEYKIKDVKVVNDKATITVTGKRLDTESMSTADMSEEATELVESYQKEHMEEIQKIYTEKGQKEAMEKVFGDIAKDLFTIFIEKIETEKGVDFTLSFELVNEKDKWLIDSIKETTKSSSEDKGTDASKEEEPDSDDELKKYKVDESKLKASATLLKKGRLEEDDYASEKYVKTDLEFIDYNVSNATGEIDKYSMIDTTSGTLKFETEVHGNKGSTIVIVISDDRQALTSDTYTLTDTKQVFTKDMTGLDVNAKYFSVRIYVGETYDEEYEYGDEVGSYLISNES